MAIATGFSCFRNFFANSYQPEKFFLHRALVRIPTSAGCFKTSNHRLCPVIYVFSVRDDGGRSNTLTPWWKENSLAGTVLWQLCHVNQRVSRSKKLSSLEAANHLEMHLNWAHFWQSPARF